LASAVAEELYFSTVRRTVNYCWREYKRRSDEIPLRAISKGAFRRHLRKMKNLREATQDRRGHRAAYKFGNNPGTGQNWITASDFPFKVGQIDGKLKDLEVVDDETGEPLGRPSITLLLLPYYRVPIGFALMLEPESYRSATMAVRDAYKRFGKVVRFLTPDNGKAFNNTTFDKLLGLLGMSKMPRPPDDPRFSAELESFWRSMDAEVIHNMSGNTQASRDAREMTEETKPERHAVWTLSALYDFLEKYFFELLWDAPSASLGTTPRKAFERDLARAPDVEEFALPANLTEIAFLPEVKNSTRIVQPGRGVYVEGYYYWNDAMEKPDLERHEVIVRYDPYDLYHVFILAGGDPIECEAKHAPELRNVTERYRHLQCMSRRRLKNNHGENREKIHGPRLAQLGVDARTQEKLMREQRRARALRECEGKKSESSGSTDSSKSTKIEMPKLDFSHLRKSA
jgi:putative transposase